MASNQTANYQLNQWKPEDKVLGTDFNADNLKIDGALAEIRGMTEAEVWAREAGDRLLAAQDSYVKLVDLTLTEDRQHWDVDVSGIDLSQYQKLVLYPRLSSNSNQLAHLLIDGRTSGYFTRSDGSTAYCAEIPTMDNTNRQNFGMCEYTMLIQLPRLYVLQLGIITSSTTTVPGLSGHNCPDLDSGVTHLSTVNFWHDGTNERILAGSTVQIYGVKR